MKVLVYQHWSGNTYCARIDEILGRLGHVTVAAARPGVLRWWRARPGCVWLNTPERYALRAAYGKARRLSPRRLLVLLITLGLMRLRGAVVVYVEHNRAVHDAGPVLTRISRRVIATVKSLAQVRITHLPPSGEPSDSGACYVPHPLYRLGSAVAVPPAFSAAPRCVIFGRIMLYKHLEDTLRWWPPGIPLVVAGECSSDAYLEQLRRLAAGKPIEFRVGRLEPEALDRLLASHDIVVVPHGESSNVVSGTFYHAISAGCLVLGRSAEYLRNLSASGFAHLEVYDSATDLAQAIVRLQEKLRHTARGKVQQDGEAQFGDAAVAEAIASALALPGSVTVPQPPGAGSGRRSANAGSGSSGQTFPRWLAALAWCVRGLRRWFRPFTRELVFEVTSRGSLGDEAMIAATVQDIRARAPQKHIVRLSLGEPPPGEEVSACNIEKLFGRQRGLPMVFARVGRLALGADRAWIPGADVLDGYYSVRRSVRRLWLAEFLARCGVATTVLGFSFNEKPAPEAVAGLRRLVGRARLVARDPVSHERLRSAGIPTELGADCAIALVPADLGKTARGAAMLAWFRAAREQRRPIIGVNANALGAHSALFGSVAQQAGFYRDLLERLTDRLDACFVLVPHDHRPAGNDAALLGRIFATLPARVQDRCLRVDLDSRLSAAEAKAIARELDFAIAGRKHFAVACLSSGVPAAVVSYQGKVHGLLQSAGVPELAVEPAAAALDAMRETVVRLAERAAALRAMLKTRELARLAALNFSTGA